MTLAREPFLPTSSAPIRRIPRLSRACRKVVATFWLHRDRWRTRSDRPATRCSRRGLDSQVLQALASGQQLSCRSGRNRQMRPENAQPEQIGSAEVEQIPRTKKSRNVHQGATVTPFFDHWRTSGGCLELRIYTCSPRDVKLGLRVVPSPSRAATPGASTPPLRAPLPARLYPFGLVPSFRPAASTFVARISNSSSPAAPATQSEAAATFRLRMPTSESPGISLKR